MAELAVRPLRASEAGWARATLQARWGASRFVSRGRLHELDRLECLVADLEIGPAGLLTYLSTAAGSNLNHDVGYLDFGLTGSLEMIVIMDEVIDQIRRIQKGIVVDEDQLAVAVIGQGGRQGQFLTQPHTLKHLRSTQWRPRLICRTGYERSSAEGRASLLDRAHERLNQILKSHTATPMEPKMAAAIEAQVSGYRLEKRVVIFI